MASNQLSGLPHMTQGMAAQRHKFDSRMTPTLLELRLGSPESIEGLTPEALGLKSVATRAKQTLRSLGETHFRVFDDPTLNDSQRLVRSAGHARALIKRSREEAADLLKAGATRHRQMEEQAQRILAPTASPGQAAIDTELRAWLRTRPAGDIPGLVRKDPQLLAAAARAPAVLSGLAPDVHKTIQGDYLRSVDPDLAAQRDDLAAGVNAALKALDTIENTAKELIDFETAEKIEGRRSDVAL